MSRMNWDKTRVKTLQNRDRRDVGVDNPSETFDRTAFKLQRLARFERALKSLEVRISSDEPRLSKDEVTERAMKWLRKNFK